MARQFGIITTVTGASSIIIQSLNKKSTVEIAEARDENGKIIDLKAYSKGESVDIKALLDSTTVTTEAGQTLTIGSKSYIIESTDQAETNTGWVEVSLTARTADSAAIAAYTETAAAPTGV